MHNEGALANCKQAKTNKKAYSTDNGDILQEGMSNAKDPGKQNLPQLVAQTWEN